MTISGCPGAAAIRGAPDLKIKICPECGEEIELFSNEMTTACTRCGFVAYNDTQSCIVWCKYARECVGDEIYEQYIKAQQAQKEEQAAQNATT